ncbi:MAG TPA: class I SAM-dependent methyltransferase [Pyrinomonadaceae bacterium]|nr:class I SAM-dependent methyltransferase [Pyrinomonadaceae bacterium]
MPTYRINPYISFIENRLFPGEVQRAVFHRLTGQLIEYDYTRSLTTDEARTRQLIQNGFLIPPDYDPLAPLADWFVARPIQNPALAYRSQNGEWLLVRTSMKQTVYSPKLDELPVVVEEQLPPLAAEIWLKADGTRTLREIISGSKEEREALDFLTTQERQLVKLTLSPEDLGDPFSSVNIVPRNLYHSERKDETTITDFHLHGIEEATWEFDFIEPTVNHSFRFPHEALGGLDYGSRFCVSTLTPEVVPSLRHLDHLEVLEVGGGTGSFARSFITQAAAKTHVNYHILDLSPALMENQRKLLSELVPASSHYHQDATRFDLPGKSFDLIVSNEVIADFPVAPVRGDGAQYVEKYDLSVEDAPAAALINTGVFRFIERAWEHLKPGGTLIVSEYGSEHRYPAASFNLNHDEYTIHFGHVAACAAKVGFDCRLLKLKEFLGLDDEVLVLNGREEHLLCLNHVLQNHGEVLPYAVISRSEFENRCGRIVEQTGLIGYSFSPLRTGYHYGPNIKDFFILIMNKPEEI